MSKPTSKVIQISELLLVQKLVDSVGCSYDDYSPMLTVLCDDGSIWRRFGHSKIWDCILEAPTQKPICEWQPIDTAPRDKAIDGWANGERLTDLTWSNAFDEQSRELCWCRTEYDLGYGERRVRVEGLTHWMPLPKAPKEETNND